MRRKYGVTNGFRATKMGGMTDTKQAWLGFAFCVLAIFLSGGSQ